MKKLTRYEIEAVSGASAAQDLSAFGKDLGGVVDKITTHLPIPYNIHHDAMIEGVGNAVGKVVDVIYDKLMK
ncbi:TPA: hypothetical protein ACYZWS_004713 [Escherichia coli]